MIGKIFRFIAPKLFMLFSVALIVWIGSVTLKEMERGNRIQEEIASLHAEAQKTQKENTVLREKIKYFQTDAFQEQEARNKLNYQRPDEQAVVIQSIPNNEPVKASEYIPSPTTVDDLLPNYAKWWKQFFKA